MESQAATPPSHKSRARTTHPRGSAGSRPPASRHCGPAQTQLRARGAHSPPASASISPDAPGSHPYPHEPVPARSGKAARDPASPAPRVGPSLAAALPLPMLPPGGGGGRPGHPSPGHARYPQAPAGPPPPQSVTAAAPGPQPVPPPAPPHPWGSRVGGGGDGLLTGRQDMVRPATARPPLLSHEDPGQGRRGAAPGPLERLVWGLLLRRRRRRSHRLLTTTTTWRQRPHRARYRRQAASGSAHARALSPRPGKRGWAVAVGRRWGPCRGPRPRGWAGLQTRGVLGARERLVQTASWRRERQVGNGRSGEPKVVLHILERYLILVLKPWARQRLTLLNRGNTAMVVFPL